MRPSHDPHGYLNPEVAELERQLDEIDRSLLQAAQTEALKRDTDVRESQRAEEENGAFWLRRFILSLQIGNGAGFLASAAVVGQVDFEAISLAAVLAWVPAAYFALGTGVAGALPLIMAAQAWAKNRPRTRYIAKHMTWAMTFSAITFFIAGMASVVVELRELGQLAEPAVTHAADPAPPSPSPAPRPPAGGPSGTPGG